MSCVLSFQSTDPDNDMFGSVYCGHVAELDSRQGSDESRGHQISPTTALPIAHVLGK